MGLTMGKNNTASLLISTAISVILLGALFMIVDLQAAYRAIFSADYALLALAAGVHVLWLMIRAQVWRSLLTRLVGFKVVLVTLGEGYLLNNFLPFRLGELGRAFLLGRKTGAPFMEVIPSVVVERFFDLVISFLLLLTISPLVLTEKNPAVWQGVIGVLLFISACVCIYALGTRKQAFLKWIYLHSTGSWPRLQEKGREIIDSLAAGFSVISGYRSFLRFFFLILLAWVVDIYLYYLLVSAFFPGATILWGCFVLVATAWGGAIPSLPGGVGTLEAAVTGAVVLLAGEESLSSALALSLVIRMFIYLFSGIIGTYGLSREKHTILDIYENLKLMRS
jgi:glycosyltransferase 2 family protein